MIRAGLLRREARRSAAEDNAPAAASSAPKNDGLEELFDGRSLAGWKVADEDEFSEHGKVVVLDGAVRLAAGNPATGIVRTAAPPRTNYEVSLQAMRTSGGDFFCGLTFPVGEQYCTLILGGWGGEVVGLSNVDDSPASENATTVFRPFQSNNWYRIRLRVTPRRIAAWIDDEQVIDLDTADRQFTIWPQQEPMRPLGIATWETGAALKDITLKRLK